MNTYITRKQVREINRKLFANDIVFSDENETVFDEIVSSIIQRYDPEDKVANVPSIIEIKKKYIKKGIVDKIMLLNQNAVFIQINNSLLGDANNIEIIKSLKSFGYKIVIELNKTDRIFTVAGILADIIKIDVKNIPEALVSTDTKFDCMIMAYNVDTATDYEMAETLHIDLYEGSYISTETSIKLELKEGSSFNYVEVLSLANKDDVEIKDIAKAISKDTLMSAQVIRLSNSVYFMGSDKISSVEQAIIRIGLDTLKKWLFLLQFSRRNDEQNEMLQLSYNRALFCEQIARKSRKIKINDSDAYLIGLFSTLDALTGKSIDKQLYNMNLSKDIEDALIYRDGPGGTILNLVKSYEEANWERVAKYAKQLALSKDVMSDIYFYCIDEVTKLWSSLTGLGGIV